MVTPPPPIPAFLDETKALACVHCGLCLASCPTYLETGNENDSPRGRIYLMRAMQEGRLPIAGTALTHLDRCLGCRACEAVCPSGVAYGTLLESSRDHIERHHRRSWPQQLLRRVLINHIFPRPLLMRLALGPARLARRLGAEAWLPRWAREGLALVPEHPSAFTPPELSPATKGTRRGPVGFVAGCVMQVMFGDTHRHSIQLLNRAGFDVLSPSAQGCCGALFAHGGYLDMARESARRNIAAFEAADLEAIIINAAGCGSTLKEYGHLLADDPEWAERAARFSARVRDLTEWLASHSESLGLEQTEGAARVTYHDACHLAHPQGITVPPRELLRAVAGDAFVELPESDVCCGSAGSYNLTEPEMARRLQERKIRHILATKAQVVVTTNPGCLLQIQAGMKAASAGHVRAMHLADYLAEPMAGRGQT